jgi:hypothetical protein
VPDLAPEIGGDSRQGRGDQSKDEHGDRDPPRQFPPPEQQRRQRRQPQEPESRRHEEGDLLVPFDQRLRGPWEVFDPLLRALARQIGRQGAERDQHHPHQPRAIQLVAAAQDPVPEEEQDEDRADHRKVVDQQVDVDSFTMSPGEVILRRKDNGAEERLAVRIIRMSV